MLEQSINLHGITLNLMDTAGIRDTEDIVEQIGVQIAKKYAKPIEFCDAFYVNENELTKIKTVKLS